ncbi:hypothetical protein BH23ACT6_BH23ACT6_21720 [soil metagenome]
MRIEAVQGDITTHDVDAIVNAANSSLMGGGGVDGAIHAAAGPTLLHECRRLRAARWHDGLPVGEALATGAGDLPAHWVIHTIGPNWHRGQRDPGLLASCFWRSLEVAQQIGARSVAFPAISAGVYGWDGADVAQIAVATVRSYADNPTDADPNAASAKTGVGADPGTRVDLVRFVLFNEPLTSLFRKQLDEPTASPRL